jgi:hypothetical protein
MPGLPFLLLVMVVASCSRSTAVEDSALDDGKLGLSADSTPVEILSHAPLAGYVRQAQRPYASQDVALSRAISECMASAGFNYPVVQARRIDDYSGYFHRYGLITYSQAATGNSGRVSSGANDIAPITESGARTRIPSGARDRHNCARPAATPLSQFGRLAPSSGQMMRRSATSNR